MGDAPTEADASQPSDRPDDRGRVGVEARTVLVVCTANQCRSAMAEGLIRARLDRDGAAEVHVESAGTWAQAGVPATDDAVLVMAERGIDITAHRAREVGPGMLAAADLVLVMTAGHREAILAEDRSIRTPLHLFSELSGARYDILDPVGQGVQAYRSTADELETLIDAGWPLILGTEESAPS